MGTSYKVGVTLLFMTHDHGLSHLRTIGYVVVHALIYLSECMASCSDPPPPYMTY